MASRASPPLPSPSFPHVSLKPFSRSLCSCIHHHHHHQLSSLFRGVGVKATHSPSPSRDITSVSSPSAELEKSEKVFARIWLAALAAGLVWSSPFLSTDAQTSSRLWVEHAGCGAAAFASGLFQMPPLKLSNRYFLVRAGESEYESKGVINTNPVAKTSMDNGLSKKGKIQTLKSAIQLKQLGACEASCWIWPSITQRAYQAAEAIAEINNVTRSRIVPEYSFLDARGLGSFEGQDIKALKEVYDADLLSPNIRPPPYTDGTPNESVADVFVRVTQLMSILETQYSGDSIIIVSPDSDNLSILQAGLTGLDLRRHSDLLFAPGEVRFIDMSSVPSPRPSVSGLIRLL